MGLWNLFRGRTPVDAEADRGAPFVVSLAGEVYSDATGRATDVALAGGATEVLAAGRWIVARGQVLVITNESPTYRSSLTQMQRAVARLAEMGIDLRGDGKGLLVILYAEIGTDGRGVRGKRYRATKSAGGVELVPETEAM